MATATTRVGKRGAVVIPAKLRERFGIKEGVLIVAEARDEGVLIRRAEPVPTETYTPARKAEFLLSNAIDAADYTRALRLVRKMGVDPAKVRHRKPRGL